MYYDLLQHVLEEKAFHQTLAGDLADLLKRYTEGISRGLEL